MTTYNINFTNPLKTPIQVDEKEINENYSVIFPGRIRLEWGEAVNENLMGLLENFSVVSSGSNQDEPDSARSKNRLQNPVKGQLWFNSSNNRIYSYDGSRWIPYALRGQQYAANYGQIDHGEQLPLPVSPDGYNFSYNECIWSVAPFSYFTGFTSVQCYSDPDDSTVTMTYESPSQGTVNGKANYLIIGIQRNVNLGTSIY